MSTAMHNTRSLAQLRRRGRERLEKEWLATYPSEREDGLGWYDAAGSWVKHLARMHNLTEECVAGIAATLSPRLPWSRAIKLTELMLDGEDISSLALGRQVRKAQNIRSGLDAEVVVSGMKVTAFYHNLLGEYQWVTIDKWSFDQVSGRDYNAGDNHMLERAGVYDMYAKSFRDVGRDVGLEPAVLQAILWIHTRGKA